MALMLITCHLLPDYSIILQALYGAYVHIFYASQTKTYVLLRRFAYASLLAARCSKPSFSARFIHVCNDSIMSFVLRHLPASFMTLPRSSIVNEQCWMAHTAAIDNDLDDSLGWLYRSRYKRFTHDTQLPFSSFTKRIYIVLIIWQDDSMVTSECDISNLIRAARFIHEFMQMS